MAKLTTEEFIEQSHNTHGQKYDYTKSQYVNIKTKIVIICKKHGEFFQNPYDHLRGKGCKKCIADDLRMSIEEFISKASVIHLNKYNYSKVIYVKNSTKVIIICPQHGEFFQTPGKHLCGRGCPKCGGTLKGNSKTFIEQSLSIHNGKYDYFRINYINNSTKVLIVCPKHGEFFQTPNHHLMGKGCIKCSGVEKSTTAEFVKKAINVHKGKYDYSIVTYNTNVEKVVIICPKHGEFAQSPANHLSGNGCPKCSHRVSIISQKWLDGLGIPQKYREKYIKVGDKRFIVDAYDHTTNTVYEFNGDFYHGNPEKYAVTAYNPIVHKTFGELYIETLKKKKTLERAGYNVISIWESTYKDQFYHFRK